MQRDAWASKDGPSSRRERRDASSALAAYGVIYAGADGRSRLLAQGAELVDLALRTGASPAARAS